MILKRKANGRTNYRKRLSLLKSGQLRLVVRKTNTQTIAQIVEYHPDADKILFTSNAALLKKKGYKGNAKSISGSYETGKLLGEAMKGKKAILDIGLQTPHKRGRIYAVVKGAIDGGLVMNVPEEVFPSEDKIKKA